MIFYQLRDKNSGLFYKRHHGRYIDCWVPQKDASVWTSRSGPGGCLDNIRRHHNDRDPEVVEIVVRESLSPQATYVTCDGREGLYLDGKVVAQGHRIRIDEILSHLGIKVDYHAAYDQDSWLDEEGYLPENLDDLKL